MNFRQGYEGEAVARLALDPDDEGGDPDPLDEFDNKFESLHLCPPSNFSRGLRLEAYLVPLGTGKVIELMLREHAADGLFRRSTGEPAARFEAGELTGILPGVDRIFPTSTLKR